MAAPYNDLLSKLEAALASVITPLALTGTRGSTAGIAVAVLTGLDDDTATLPRVVCLAKDSTEEAVRDSGIFKVACSVHVFTHSSDETLAVHRERVASVGDAIMTDDRAAVLSAAVDDFHCYDLQMGGVSAEPDENCFHTAFDFTAVCMASDVS